MRALDFFTVELREADTVLHFVRQILVALHYHTEQRPEAREPRARHANELVVCEVTCRRCSGMNREESDLRHLMTLAIVFIPLATFTDGVIHDMSLGARIDWNVGKRGLSLTPCKNVLYLIVSPMMRCGFWKY